MGIFDKFKNLLYFLYMYPNMGLNLFYLFPFIWPLVLLDLILKGFALWRSARNNQIYWFIALLIVNSMGILPLIYLIAIDKNHVFKTLSKTFKKG